MSFEEKPKTDILLVAFVLVSIGAELVKLTLQNHIHHSSPHQCAQYLFSKICDFANKSLLYTRGERNKIAH